VALQCVDIYIGDVWMGLWGWSGAIKPHKKALTFKGPIAQQTSVYGIGMHKIPPNLGHTLCLCFMGPSENLKSSLHNSYRSHSAVKNI